MSYEEENKYNHLEELNGSDYQIVDGEPDITGFDVIDGQDRKVGKVDDVLFDPNTREVRYIIVDLEENELNIAEAKKVLVPIGIAELRDEGYHGNTENTRDTETERGYEGVGDEAAFESNNNDDYDNDDFDDVVFLPTITAAHIQALPAYEKGMLSPERETAIRNVFEGKTTEAIVPYHPDTFYAHEHFNNKIYPKNDSPANNTDGTVNLNSGTDDLG